METRKRKRLEAAGWRVGAASEFLGLSTAEEALVEMRLALSDMLRRLRVKRGLTQGVVAKRLQSSQSRVAKMEAGDPTVSLELLIRALLVAGASRSAVASALTKRVA
jgi:DNA-binding XRE family transcriptional regulator